MVSRQEKCLNSGISRMTITVTFWPWSQSFIIFCFETLAFFFYLFSFCYVESRRVLAPLHLPPGVVDLGTVTSWLLIPRSNWKS